MALLDVKEETAKFEAKLKSGYFDVEVSSNSEVNYAMEKEDRDSESFNEFLNSSYFDILKDMV